MIRAMNEFVSAIPSMRKDEFRGNRNIRHFDSPYLFWHRHRSTTALKGLEPHHQELMKLLVGYIEKNYLSCYIEADELFSRGLVTASTVQYLIRPGEVIVNRQNDTYTGLRASGWASLKTTSSLKELWSRHHDDATAPPSLCCAVKARTYVFDGDFSEKIEFCEFSMSVHTEEETLKICDLDTYPLKYASPDLQLKLLKRGQRFRSFLSKQLVSHVDDKDESLANTGGRFMIDHATYKILHPKTGALATHKVPEKRKMLSSTLNDSDLYLYPNKVTGYNLRQKKWMDLEVDRISDVVWQKQAFEHLVVEDGIKELVQALITNQITAEKGTDLIKNKGNGLIMLLHGGPGTGKTFTAEGVAEMAERPLFRVTCGDIGTKSEEVEKYLESVLHLGKIWGCVVLLDEADVFLEQRTLNDLTRNALVSVFLRVLEYYDGILILTSNRVGTFDEAFKSRIQLALHYDALNRAQRSRIWSNFFNRLQELNEESIDYVDIARHIDELADVEMNGRQIRNAITTARQLAQFQGKDMSYEHLKHVITVASKFDRHLGSTRGFEEHTGSEKDDATTTSKYTCEDWRMLNGHLKGNDGNLLLGSNSNL